MGPRLVTLTNGAFAENCHLVADPQSGEAAIVDPGEEADLFLARLAHEGWALAAIWLTHAHVDHVAGVAAVKAATRAPIFLHPDDRPLYDRAGAQGAAFGLAVPDLPPPDRALADGDTLAVGGCRFRVLHTPGHSPGGVCLVGHGLALVGDTLFAGSIGRTDLPGGDYDTLMRSIKDVLFSFGDDAVVYPGHGPTTTIGQERRTNPFLLDL